MRILTLIVSLIAALSLTATPATAKTFRWSFASDIPSMDIHSQNNALANMVHGAIYESLVIYNSRTFAPEPLLATG
ncbi:MAG: ABC transporter substrate-binding protein, partial [Burkholderiaceae bacterium]